MHYSILVLILPYVQDLSGFIGDLIRPFEASLGYHPDIRGKSFRTPVLYHMHHCSQPMNFLTHHSYSIYRSWRVKWLTNFIWNDSSSSFSTARTSAMGMVQSGWQSADGITTGLGLRIRIRLRNAYLTWLDIKLFPNKQRYQESCFIAKFMLWNISPHL